MDEFGLIDAFFTSISPQRDDVLFGIGDDAAGLMVPPGKTLLVSVDTLVDSVHFLSSWDPFDIAYRAVMVNLSDMAAMGGEPSWVTLALTLPEANTAWLRRFSAGLREALQQFHVALVGGDTTRGPLSVTLTIHGWVDNGAALRRNGARVGDKIYVSGPLGAAGFAVELLTESDLPAADQAVLMKALLHPKPRFDLVPHLTQFASSAIDISDGLLADLTHICQQSGVGARIDCTQVPIHPIVQKHRSNPMALALNGGDDYELCFTIPAERDAQFLLSLASLNGLCYPIGWIEEGSHIVATDGTSLLVRGYTHF